MVTKIEQFEQPPLQQQNDESAAHQRPFEEIRNIISLVTPVPGELLLGSLRDGRLRVCSPIEVRIITEGEHVVAEAIEFNEFGFGKNPSEALIDLQRAIAELYFTLDEEQGRLGEELQRVWVGLRQRIQRR